MSEAADEEISEDGILYIAADGGCFEVPPARFRELLLLGYLLGVEFGVQASAWPLWLETLKAVEKECHDEILQLQENPGTSFPPMREEHRFIEMRSHMNRTSVADIACAAVIVPWLLGLQTGTMVSAESVRVAQLTALAQWCKRRAAESPTIAVEQSTMVIPAKGPRKTRARR